MRPKHHTAIPVAGKSADAELVIIDVESATAVARAALERFGAPAEAAQCQAEHLVEGDLRGRPSHGLLRLPTLISRIENGVLDPRADAELTWRTDSALVVDGHDGFGPHVGFRALAALLERSRATGVAVGAVRRSGHLGMLAPYVERAVADDAIAVVFTTSEALVHPTGAGKPMVGTNPIAIGVPTESDPFILDMSTAAISAGEVIAHAQRGWELPEGVAVDAEGRATTDPGAARLGAVSPFGGSKGYALALGFELLVASLSSTAMGTGVHGTLDVDQPSTKGDVIVILRPDAFGASHVRAFASAYLQELRDLPAAPGTGGVSIPGDRARAVRLENSAAGVPLPAALWRDLVALADREGALS